MIPQNFNDIRTTTYKYLTDLIILFSSLPFSLPLYLELFIDSAYFCISTRSYNFKDRDYFHNVNTLHSAWHFVVIQTLFVFMN